MSEMSLLWKVGIDHVTPESALPDGAVADAVNVDFDRAGGFASRPGATRLLTGNVHSLWTAENGQAYGVVDGVICRLDTDGSTIETAAAWTLGQDLPVTYADLNDDVIAATQRELVSLGRGECLGLPTPSDAGLAAETWPETYGGLTSGRYGVALAHLRGDEESGLSDGAFVEVAEGGGLRLALPQPDSALNVTAMRVYRTAPNGEVYHRVADVPLGITSYLLGATPLGRPADTQYLEPLPGGHYVRAWRGRVLVARGNVLRFSQPLRFGLHDPRTDFVQFEQRIDLLEPVDGGVFVGTRDGVVFLAGERPGAWAQRRTSGKAPVPGTGISARASDLGGDVEGRVAVWLARNGFVIGTAQGAVLEVQAKRIRLPQVPTSGALLLRERRLIATVD